MKIAILFTAYRQLEELKFQSAFLRRCKVFNKAEIVYINNNQEISNETLNTYLDKLSDSKHTLIRSTNKGGYAYGQFEAILSAWQTLLDNKYEWVIHLHPDIFIADENKLIKAIKKTEVKKVAMLVSKIFSLTHQSYATDAFAFKPQETPKEIFESFKSLAGKKKVVPLEELFFQQINRLNVSHLVVNRFLTGRYYRDIDQWGLWHEHNLLRVKLYFIKPCLRWLVSIYDSFTRPLFTVQIFKYWHKRKINKTTQESLLIQLTAGQHGPQ